MKKIIVTTTINPITEAIHKYQQLKDWDLVVVGDKKTPSNYTLQRGTYFSCKDQEKYDRKLSDTIGWNSIQRRNFGYLWAYDMGAEIIASVDDDNIPLQNWGKNLLVGKDTEVNYYSTDEIVFDPIGVTNYPHLWHRGFPLQLVPTRKYNVPSKRIMHVDVQADFWNGDPDIDAVCRMIYAPNCNFSNTYFPFTSNSMSPFNSQNTFIHRSVLKDYFVYPGIGRMDDIWGSYYFQLKHHTVIYNKATVIQKRNIHDVIKDMKAEYIGYEHTIELLGAIVSDSSRINEFLPDQAVVAQKLYQKHFR